MPSQGSGASAPPLPERAAPPIAVSTPPSAAGKRVARRVVTAVALLLGGGAIAACHVQMLGAARRSLVTDPAAAYEALGWLVALDVALFLGALAVIFIRHHRAAARLEAAGRRFEIEVARARATFEHALDPIVGFDDRGRIAAVNAAASALFRMPAAAMVGAPVTRFLPCGTNGPDGSFIPASVETLVCADVHPVGSGPVPVELSLNHAVLGDETTYTAVVRDVSARVVAEERARLFAATLERTNRQLEEANAQLEEASKLKSEFLANTSHELRTPLNGMIGFLQLVLDGMCDSPEEEREFLEQALECSRHLLGLINDVLDIAKIEAGKLTLEIEAVDVRSLFGEIYTLTHVQAAQKGLTLTFETGEGDAPRVRGDFGKAKQVLVNLVGNSLKFTSHGSITVRATERPELGHVLFEVIDTGIGVPPERQRMIFDKFTQGDGSTTRKYGGTGLGLAISKSLVELMGGVIGIESPESVRGTRMFFTLPLWRSESPEDEAAANGNAAREAAPVPERIEGPPGGALVHVVEDDPVFTKFIVALLHHHGYRTVTSTSAETAWVLARRHEPDAMVLDYALTSSPNASLRTGWDLAERMASDPHTRHVPLLFVTGFEVIVKERLKGGALAQAPEHLLKPVEGAALIRKIEDLIGARSGVVRVLMADDDPSVTAYVRKVLPNDRFHLDVVNNGEECLHALRMQPSGFDLLLLDLMMPDVSGYDVLRELVLKRETRDLPVLILTNFPEARNDEEKRLLERGLVLDVIAKSSVHENPSLLPHIIDWHLQVARELGHEIERPPGFEKQEAA